VGGVNPHRPSPSIRMTAMPLLEANDRHDEHVHGGADCCAVTKKVFLSVLGHGVGDGRLRDLEPELKQFRVKEGSAVVVGVGSMRGRVTILTC
jgi:hypothetical protein